MPENVTSQGRIMQQNRDKHKVDSAKESWYIYLCFAMICHQNAVAKFLAKGNHRPEHLPY